MKEDISKLFSEVAQYDSSLKIEPTMNQELRARRIAPSTFSRGNLFRSMAKGEIVLCKNYPTPTLRGIGANAKSLIRKELSTWHRSRKIRVSCGPSATTKYITGKQLMERWEAARGIVNVTDLHIRNSKIESIIDPHILSWFNLLVDCSEDTSRQEMMTMVVSSAGSLSDSHSDAPDGSNYCFEGRKMWLMWDTFEGFECGMQDCSRESVESKCSFDMKRFLSMKSSRWLTISPGQTLFLPGDYTHKVVTLEKYIGIGSFYVNPHNCLRTLSRWLLHGPLWALSKSDVARDSIIFEVAGVAEGTVKKIKTGSKNMQRKWEYDLLAHSLRSWKRSTSEEQRRFLQTIPHFNDYLSVLAV